MQVALQADPVLGSGSEFQQLAVGAQGSLLTM